jgi:hypothetical protein
LSYIDQSHSIIRLEDLKYMYNEDGDMFLDTITSSKLDKHKIRSYLTTAETNNEKNDVPSFLTQMLLPLNTFKLSFHGNQVILDIQFKEVPLQAW